jgi:hypothetical protein
MSSNITLINDPLPADQRSCLLRAARREVRRLESEVQRHELILPAKYAAGPLTAARVELECLSLAVAWLWRQHP